MACKYVHMPVQCNATHTQKSIRASLRESATEQVFHGPIRSTIVQSRMVPLGTLITHEIAVSRRTQLCTERVNAFNGMTSNEGAVYTILHQRRYVLGQEEWSFGRKAQCWFVG